MLVPSPEEFLNSAHGDRPTPVYRDLMADMLTPLGAYWRLAHDETYSFLLESVTGGEQLARYSIIGIRPRKVVRSKGSSVRLIEGKQEERITLKPGEDPLTILKQHVPPLSASIPGMPKFTGGAVGLLGYDLVRFLERLPDSGLDDLKADDMAMMIVDSVVVFDHARNIIRVIVNARGTRAAYDEAAEKIDAILEKLKGPLPDLPGSTYEPGVVRTNFDETEFLKAVETAKAYIAAGDCIQTVISQRFECEVNAHPMTLYRALRSLNPSPYMYLLRFGDFDVIGASPEILVSLDGDVAKVRPIAGTRWRGGSPEEDKALEKELLADEKELAEHIMLVDLGRNDLGRVCKYGTVVVNDLMTIERYSHVMHIVSDVTAELGPGQDAFSLIRATFPAGTVSGAPKVRAMEIIDELEPTRRGLYAGAVGYISSAGDMDMCIAIRTIFLKDGKAYVQAGGGIVYDSVPVNELNESRNKARACLRAIEIAQSGLES